MEKATKAFWSDKHIYTCRAINLRKRLHLFRTRILPILLYGCEIWILTPKVMNTIETWLKRMCRIIFRMNKTKQEEWPEYWKRTTEKIEEFLRKIAFYRPRDQVINRILKYAQRVLKYTRDADHYTAGQTY